MTDIAIAKAALHEEHLSICVVKNGSIIYKNTARGIYPLYEAIVLQRLDFKGASSADKVVGRGAMRIYEYAGLERLFCNILSENAKNCINTVHVDYSQLVPFIQNREKTGMCPIENATKDARNIEEHLQAIQEFLTTVGMLK